MMIPITLCASTDPSPFMGFFLRVYVLSVQVEESSMLPLEEELAKTTMKHFAGMTDNSSLTACILS